MQDNGWGILFAPMEQHERKVGIVWAADWLDPAYSLSSVIVDQLHALVKNGERVVLFVLDNFNTPAHALAVPDAVEIRPVFPRFALIDYAAGSTLQDTKHFPRGGTERMVSFDEQVVLIRDALSREAKDITHFFCHDLIFQGWFLPYAVALHQYASDRDDARFFHWTHSFPGARPHGLGAPHTARFSLPAHSKLVYLNHHDQVALAEAYSTFPVNVEVVPNSYDPLTAWNLDPLTKQIVEDTHLLQADVVSVYPLSTPRMGPEGKQLDIVVKIHAAMKRLGKKTVLIVPNAHAAKNGQIILDMRRLAQHEGLSEREVVFTSEYEGYEQGVSRAVVRELFQLANVFIFPSVSEVCSLVLLEAAAAKNLLVLNKDWQSMREFGGDDALYFRFGANGYPLTLSGEPERYWHDIALIVLSTLQKERALSSFHHVLSRHNLSTLYQDHLRPLLCQTPR